jgi:hypothetical protein
VNESALITIGIVFFGLVASTPFVRRSRKKASIDFAQAALELSQSELKTEREAREAQESRCNDKIAEQDRRHASEIGELRGRVMTLTESFARVIAAAVIEAIKQDGAV